jgi:hypothetical protein
MKFGLRAHAHPDQGLFYNNTRVNYTFNNTAGIAPHEYR